MRVVLGLLLCLPLVAYGGECPTEEYAPGHVLVKRHGQAVERMPVERGRVKEAVERLKAEPGIEYAEPDYIYTVQLTPNDSRWLIQQEDMRVIHMPEAWDVSTGSLSVIVAVIDTGVSPTHEDLIHFVPGYDFWHNDPDPRDEAGHGTHVAGTCCAATNNLFGVAGAAWTVTVMPVRGLGPCGSGFTSDLAAAVTWACDHGARVINASWGGSSYSQTLSDAIAACSNTLFVAAAGNNARDTDVAPFYPASYDAPNIISVGATDNADAMASFSNWGLTSVDIAAPGVDIVSTWWDEKARANLYAYNQGTSMSAPHVAGVAALIVALHPEWTAVQVKDAIMAGADPVASWAGKSVTGGRLNAAGAVAMAQTAMRPGRAYGRTHKRP